MDPVELCAEDSNHLYYQQHVDLEKDQMIRKLLFMYRYKGLSINDVTHLGGGGIFQKVTTRVELGDCLYAVFM